jgi:hypothetical protein
MHHNECCFQSTYIDLKAIHMVYRKSDEALSHMCSTYGSFFDTRSLEHLNPDNVPLALRPVMPYAAFWGITDDLEREHLVESAPQAARQDLARVVNAIDDQLDEWLAGPESEKEFPTKEYAAFSAMRMAALYI